MPYLPTAVNNRPEINAAVSEVVRLLAPDVVQIRFDIARIGAAMRRFSSVSCSPTRPARCACTR